MNIPTELIYIIIGQLSSKNRSELCTVSKSMYHDIIAYSKTIWPTLYGTDRVLINDYHLLMRLKNKYIMKSQMVFTTNDLDVISFALKFHKIKKDIEIAIHTAAKYGHLNTIKLLRSKNKRVKVASLSKHAIKYRYMDIINYIIENGDYCMLDVCKYANLELAKRLFHFTVADIPANMHSFILENKNEEAVNYMTSMIANYINLNCTTMLVTESDNILALERLLALGVLPRDIRSYIDDSNVKIPKYLKNHNL
jgi:hypothetical protein